MMDEIVYRTPESIVVSNADREAEAMKKAADRAIAEKNGRLVIDMSDTGFVSSAGLKALMTAMKRIRGAGGEFVLRHLSERVYESVELTGLCDFITIE